MTPTYRTETPINSTLQPLVDIRREQPHVSFSPVRWPGNDDMDQLAEGIQILQLRDYEENGTSR